jgi:hypothetical protein
MAAERESYEGLIHAGAGTELTVVQLSALIAGLLLSLALAGADRDGGTHAMRSSTRDASYPSAPLIDSIAACSGSLTGCPPSEWAPATRSERVTMKVL